LKERLTLDEFPDFALPAHSILGSFFIGTDGLAILFLPSEGENFTFSI